MKDSPTSIDKLHKNSQQKLLAKERKLLRLSIFVRMLCTMNRGIKRGSVTRLLRNSKYRHVKFSTLANAIDMEFELLHEIVSDSPMALHF